MITLYDKLETDFQHNGIGSLDQNIIDPKIHWIDNGVFSFEFEYPLFAKHGLKINNSSIVKARDPEQENLFFVYKVIPSMGYIKVYAYQMFYKLAFNTINDTNIVNKTGQGALTQMSGGTQYPHKFKFASDILNTANSRVVRKNPVEFLLNSNLDNSFVNRWGGHIIRNGFNISMNQSYGSNKGYTIRHKKDLVGYEAVIDESTVVTRIRPVGYDGLLLPEMFVDSPLINNYPEPRIQEYEYPDVKVGSDEGDFPSNELAYAELRRLAKLEYSQNKVDVPNGVYKIDFVNLKETEEYKNFAPLKRILPGDTVAVKHEEDGVNILAQMVEYNWNPLLKEYIDLTLGNYEKSFTSTVNKLDKIQTDLKDLNNQIELVYLSSNGKNQIHTGETEPVINQNSTEGDLWFKKNGDKTEIWILREINSALQWVIELSDATQEELRAELESIIGQVALDRIKTEQDIKNAIQEANDYAEFLSVKWDEDFNLEVNKINKDINDARTAAIADAKSYTNTKTTELNNYLETVKLDVLSVSTKADTAVTKADKAISDVGFMKVDLNTVTNRANDAFSAAQTSLTNSGTAISTANTAKVNSETALSTANTAKTNAGTALSTAQTAITNSGTAVTNAQNALNAYNNLEIGGRNLILKSAVSKILPVSTSNHSYLTFVSNEIFVEGQTYTFSSDIEILAGSFTQISFLPRTINGAGGRDNKIITIVNNRIVISFVAGANEDRIYIYAGVAGQTANNGMRLFNYNLVKGNKAIGWSPAPEDVQVQITDINGELSRKVSQSTFDTLNGTVTNQGTLISQSQTAVGLKADKTVVDTINQTVSAHTLSIKATADSLATKAEKTLVDSINGTVNTHTNQLKINADGLALKADKSLVDTVKGTVDIHTTQIKATSDGLALKADSSLVNTVKGTVDTHTAQIKATSDGLALKAEKTLVDSINNTVGTHTTQIKATSDGLGLKADKNLVDTINNTVSKHTTDIKATADGLLLKAEKSLVDTVKGVVDKHTTDIKVVADGLALKAESSLVNTINGTVANHTNQISANSTAINARLTSTQVDNLLSTKKYVNETMLAATSSGLTAQITQVSNDLSKTDTKVTTFEATVNGIQTTVESKADKSQITQLNNQIATKVESATYATKMTQLDSAINLRVVQGDVTAAILADKKIKDTRNTNETPTWYYTKYPRSTVEEFKGRNTMGVPGLATYGQLTTKVPWDDPSGGVITQVFSSSDGVFQRVGSGTAWLAWDKVAEAGKLVSQINLSTEGVLIQGKVIQLDGQVNMDAAFINKMKAFSIEAVNADITNIRTKILTADVITSVHLKVDNAMMDKLIATTAVVNYLFTKTAFVDNLNTKTLTAITANIATIRSQVLIANAVDATMIKADVATITKLFAAAANVNILTSNSAFITNIKAIDISADRIKTGILNAANVTIINLDASKITTGTLNAIDITGTKITNNFSISSEGATLTGTTVIAGDYRMNYTVDQTGQTGNMIITPIALSSQILTRAGSLISSWEISSTGLRVSNSGLATAYTASGFTFYPSGSGTPATVQYIPGNARIAISSYNGVELGSVVGGQHSVRFAVGGGNGVNPFVDMRAKTTVYDNDFAVFGDIEARSTGSGDKTIVRSDGGNGWIMGRWSMRMGILGSDNKTGYEKIRVENGGTTFFNNILMNGNSILNQSDSRLKTAIRDTELKALDLVKSYRFVDFLWIDKNKPQGLQTGLIAQDTQYLSSEGPDGYLVLDSSKQNMLNTQAIQELSNVVDLDSIRLTKAEKGIVDLNNLAVANETQLTNHEKRIKELEEKIKELEGKVA